MPANLTLLDLLTLTFYEEHSRSSSLCIFLQVSVIYSL
jgi:hypothetical protein